jgi:nitrate/nitrite transport system ATP-binding protein
MQSDHRKTAMIVEHVSKSFPVIAGGGNTREKEVVVFENVFFKVFEGEFLTMVGHSGCGKSTLLNIMAGFDRSSTGGIIVNNKEVTSPGLDRMVVFQSFALMPWLTAFDNVRVAVRSAHPDWTKAQVREHTQKYIDTMGLSGAERKRPAFLSGGMRQRVGLARAFSVNPKVLLLDEPFAQIDALTRGVIQDELMRMWAAVGATVFMVTHDVDEAILLSDRIALMTSGPNARLAEIIDVEIPRPRTRQQLIELPEYMRIRNHILHFLISSHQQKMSTESSKAIASMVAPGSNGRSQAGNEIHEPISN